MSSSSLPPHALADLGAEHLGCRRGRRWLFQGLELQQGAGRLTWLRGRNGSGKTSLLRLLAGLSHPAQGQVLWGGRPRSEHKLQAQAGVLYLGHANALKEDLTLLEALAFLADLAGLDDGAGRSARALNQVGLATVARQPVRTLSQGQRRRGALARLAMDERPRHWLLDEPFDALDAPSVQALAALLQAHAARGGSVLLTSHLPLPMAADEIDLQQWAAA